MTAKQLREHVWNYRELAKSAELHAMHAESAAEIDAWNNCVIAFDDMADWLTIAAERAEERAVVRLPLGFGMEKVFVG